MLAMPHILVNPRAQFHQGLPPSGGHLQLRGYGASVLSCSLKSKSSSLLQTYLFVADVHDNMASKFEKNRIIAGSNIYSIVTERNSSSVEFRQIFTVLLSISVNVYFSSPPLPPPTPTCSSDVLGAGTAAYAKPIGNQVDAPQASNSPRAI